MISFGHVLWNGDGNGVVWIYVYMCLEKCLCLWRCNDHENHLSQLLLLLLLTITTNVMLIQADCLIMKCAIVEIVIISFANIVDSTRRVKYHGNSYTHTNKLFNNLWAWYVCDQHFYVLVLVTLIRLLFVLLVYTTKRYCLAGWSWVECMTNFYNII